MRVWMIAACLCAATSSAHAFCGFYVAGSDQQLVNDATQVVLMRMGTRTVLAMENAYQGPPDAFAMVVPVPAVLHEGDVKTLPKEVFAHVEQMGAPRLVEYWEQDPCTLPAAANGGRAVGEDTAVLARQEVAVKIEAKFAVGEYQIVILSAKDSTGLVTWLRDNHYTIPAGAEPLLRPYIEAGMKFFVAKVDPTKVKLDHGRAVLSPLRFDYDADDFALPIRLGMASSAGTQDLIVNILAPHQRYRVANYDNVTIPTNLDLDASVKDRFGAVYAALFDATLAKHPHAVVTEYAWQASSCDPCPGPVLDASELQTLGADVLAGERGRPTRYDGDDFVLTRLHARYGKDLANDLVFERARPIEGGREDTGHGATAAETNRFQARYAIRHPWTGPIRCERPGFGRWGGPPDHAGEPVVQPALDLATAPRGGVQLASVVSSDVPELGTAAPERVRAAPRLRTGSCAASDPAGLALVLVLVIRPKRRRRR
jgi:hypothetical protein